MQEINDSQKKLYEKYDLEGSRRYLDRYLDKLEAFTDRKNIKILDIGGASGHFALLLKEFFSENNVEVYVVDNTRYDTWSEDELGKDIHFVHDSVEHLDVIFEDNTFDIVFANRVFHHFILDSWRKSLNEMESYLWMINGILKPDGMLFVMDHFYNGMVIDSATSFWIYTLTSVKNPAFAKIVKKLGAMTAGVGVCFQSEKMWIERIQKCGFEIKKVDSMPCDKYSRIKKLALFCKSMSRNNIICATPKK